MSMDIVNYRQSLPEIERVENLLEVIPKGRSSVLDIGARDGHIAKMLTPYFKSVTALDLEKPSFSAKNIIKVKGDITCLDFPDNSFDTVLCAEVLEHISPNFLSKACDEIRRVAKCDVIIGVPYEQDIRVSRTTCFFCGEANPPWGHVNSFTENKLKDLFHTLTHVSSSFVGVKKAKTNFLSTFLYDLADNPWGDYSQEEACIYCGKQIVELFNRNIFQKVCSKFAFRVNKVQELFVSSSPKWIHMVLKKVDS